MSRPLARAAGEDEDSPYRLVTGWLRTGEYGRPVKCSEREAEFATLWGKGDTPTPCAELIFCPSDVWLGKTLGVKQAPAPALGKVRAANWQDLN